MCSDGALMQSFTDYLASTGKYTLFVGGRLLGDRLAFLYKDMVPEEEITPTLTPLFAYFKAQRQESETFGEFCDRKGLADLQAFAADYQHSN